MDDIAIKVDNVSKVFKLPHERHTSIKSSVVNFYRRKRTYEKQQALNNVSFEVKRGEFFGIIGRNGSGKSTMLKTLAGIYVPTKGSVQINGKLTPFIELGVGFNPELSGRDNVFLNGALLGFNRKEMQAMYEDIVEFAELEKFMDQKLKNYSSGMQVRLAFSIAIRAKSDILLIDEVLAVGDSNFQKKCLAVFDDLKRNGRTIVFVSHSMGDVREFCDRVAVINNGDLIFLGNTEKGIDHYNKLNFEEESRQIEAENAKGVAERYGNGKAEIAEYKFLNDEGKPTAKLAAGEKFSAVVEVIFHDVVANPAVGVMFKKNTQENLFGLNNYYDNESFGRQSPGDKLRVTYQGIMPLAPGQYFVSFSVTDAKSASNYSELDMLDNVIKVNINGKSRWGLITSRVKMKGEKL